MSTRPPLRVASVGIAAPAVLGADARRALHGTLALSEVERRAAAARARRLDVFARPAPGLSPVVATTNDISLAGADLDAAVLLGLAPPEPTHAGRVLALLRTGVSPTLTSGRPLALWPDKPLREAREAVQRGVPARTVLPGPVSLLLRWTRAGDPFARLYDVLAAYAELVKLLIDAGVDGIQLDEPALVGPLSDATNNAFMVAYARLRHAALRRCDLVLTASPAALAPSNVALAARLSVDVLHLDLVRRRELLAPAVAERRGATRLAIGVAPDAPDSARQLCDLAVAAIGAANVEIAPHAALPDDTAIADLARLAELDPPRFRSPRPPAVTPSSTAVGAARDA